MVEVLQPARDAGSMSLFPSRVSLPSHLGAGCHSDNPTFTTAGAVIERPHKSSAKYLRRLPRQHYGVGWLLAARLHATTPERDEAPA
jgi:hypothetical protein